MNAETFVQTVDTHTHGFRSVLYHERMQAARTHLALGTPGGDATAIELASEVARNTACPLDGWLMSLARSMTIPLYEGLKLAELQRKMKRLQEEMDGVKAASAQARLDAEKDGRAFARLEQLGLLGAEDLAREVIAAKVHKLNGERDAENYAEEKREQMQKDALGIAEKRAADAAKVWERFASECRWTRGLEAESKACEMRAAEAKRTAQREAREDLAAVTAEMIEGSWCGSTERRGSSNGRYTQHAPALKAALKRCIEMAANPHAEVTSEGTPSWSITVELYGRATSLSLRSK